MNTFRRKAYLIVFCFAIMLLVFLFTISNNNIRVFAADEIVAEIFPNDTNSYVKDKVTVKLTHTAGKDIFYRWARFSSVTNQQNGQSDKEEKYLGVIEFTSEGYYEVYAYTKEGEESPIKTIRTAHIDKTKPTINTNSIKVDIDFFEKKAGLPTVKISVSVSDEIENGIKYVSLEVENQKAFFKKSISDESNNRYDIEFTPNMNLDYSSAILVALDMAGNEDRQPLTQIEFLQDDDIFTILEDVKNELRKFNSDLYTENGKNLVDEKLADFKTSLFSDKFQYGELMRIFNELKVAIEGKPTIKFEIKNKISATNLTINATITAKNSQANNILRGSDIKVILDNPMASQQRIDNIKEKASFFSGIKNPTVYAFSIMLNINDALYENPQDIEIEIDFLHKNIYEAKLYRDMKNPNDPLEEVILSTTIDKAKGTAVRGGDFYLVVQEKIDDNSGMLSIGGKLYKKSTIGITIGIVLFVIALTIVIVVIVNKQSDKKAKKG